MNRNEAADQTRIALEARVWGYRQHGWSQQRIADAVGLDQSTVSRTLARVEKREYAKLAQRVGAARARQNAILEHLIDESIQAWERSKKPATRASKKTVTQPLPPGPDGTAPPAEQGPVVELTQVEQRDGDQVHLNAVMLALRDLRKLWGIDTPAAEASAGGLTVADAVKRLKANAEFHDATEPDPQPEPEPEPEPEPARDG